jgi:heme/copper-type cytochrome/quinol oxidase subunit 2
MNCFNRPMRKWGAIAFLLAASCFFEPVFAQSSDMQSVDDASKLTTIISISAVVVVVGVLIYVLIRHPAKKETKDKTNKEKPVESLNNERSF